MFVHKRGTLVLNVKARLFGNGCTYVHNICLCPKSNAKMKGDSKCRGSVEKVKSEQNTKSEKVKVTTLIVGSNVVSDQPTDVKYKSVLPTATILLKGVKGIMVGA